MSFNVIHENKILAKISESTVVLVQPRKTRSFITERLGCKESNQTNKIIYVSGQWILFVCVNTLGPSQQFFCHVMIRG